MFDDSLIFHGLSHEFRAKIVTQKVDNDIGSDDEYIEKSIVKMTRILSEGIQTYQEQTQN